MRYSAFYVELPYLRWGELLAARVHQVTVCLEKPSGGSSLSTLDIHTHRVANPLIPPLSGTAQFAISVFIGEDKKDAISRYFTKTFILSS